MIYKNALLLIKDVVKFIEDVFGSGQFFEIHCGDEIMRSEGRRADDVTGSRTFLEQKTTGISFSVTCCFDSAVEGLAGLPAVFTNPDYPKVLRHRYRELNRTEIKFWKIDCRLAQLPEGGEGRQEVTFDFTVDYGTETHL
jgi:hypothetical protein